MKISKISSTAVIVLLSVMPVLQLQAAGPYSPYTAQKNIPKTMLICKPVVVGSLQHSNRRIALTYAKRVWARNTEGTYGLKAKWANARNKTQSCQFDKTRTGYICEARAKPCYSGAAQNSQ